MSAPRGAVHVAWFALGPILMILVLAGLLVFRAQNRIALAEANTALAEANTRATEQALAIERVLSERLARETVDLAEVRLALLSPADSSNASAFAVVWSPSNGDGVLLRIANPKLPDTVHFKLLASRRISSDRIEQDSLFHMEAPTSLARGLFHYLPAHPAEVSGFTLEITSSSAPDSILRFGGPLNP